MYFLKHELNKYRGSRVFSMDLSIRRTEAGDIDRLPLQGFTSLPARRQFLPEAGFEAVRLQKLHKPCRAIQSARRYAVKEAV